MAGRVRGILESLLRRRRELALSEVVGDAELLRRFTATRDEAAFELLVWRHGTMVLGVCRRAVRDAQLAEDAFQAVFLVLARKAHSIRGGNVAGWLFRIARRVAARAARRRPVLRPLPELIPAPQAAAVEDGELTEILDAEVARLPEKLRRAVILCYLGGQATEDAARELGCPRGTVLSRLATARKRLAARLERRGIAAPLFGAAIVELTTGRLVSQTIVAVRHSFLSPATTAPALLAESVVHAMAATRLMVACGAIILAAGLTLGVGWGAAKTDSDEGESPLAASAPKAGQPAEAPLRVEQEKDKKPPMQGDSLRRQSDAIARRIEELRARIAQETPDEGVVDVSVLQAELFEVDKQILRSEKQTKIEERGLVEVNKNKDAAAAIAIEERDLSAVVDRNPAVHEAMARLTRAKQTAVTVKTKLTGEEHPVVQAAKKEVVEAEAALKDARTKAGPEAERVIRNNMAKHYTESAANSRKQIALNKNTLSDLIDVRRKLVMRIAEVRRGEAKQQVLLDELKVLREIQLELLRHQTLRELGIEVLQQPSPRANIDPHVDAQIKDLKREIEALRSEVEKLRKKN